MKSMHFCTYVNAGKWKYRYIDVIMYIQVTYVTLIILEFQSRDHLNKWRMSGKNADYYLS